MSEGMRERRAAAREAEQKTRPKMKGPGKREIARAKRRENATGSNFLTP